MGSPGEPSGSSAGRTIALVPLGAFPRADALALARRVRVTLGVDADVLSSSPLPKTAFDRRRKQYVAEDLFPVLRDRRTGARVAQPMIGLVVEDMYTRGTPSWRFAFGIRSLDGLAVVSRARMDPRLFGLTADPALRLRRLQKMVTRDLGILALGRRLTRNPRSVLYDTILSTDDLDYMTEQFQPTDPSAARRRWLSRSGAVCERGIVEMRALVARSTLNTQVGFLIFAHSSLELQEHHRELLAAVPPAHEDRSAVRAMLDRFRRTLVADREALASLAAHWSDARLKRVVSDDVRASAELKSNALELGSRSCARYFVPGG